METHTSEETPIHIEMASTFVARDLKHQIASLYIKCVNGETRTIPHNPVCIFTEEDLDNVNNVKQRIFYSYFSPKEVRLHTKLSFEPEKEFDYLLLGIYHKKCGMDEELSMLLDRRPELFIFTLNNYFEALFTPYLEYTDFDTITMKPEDENFPLCIILDDEPYDCLTLAERLHNSPLLKDVTFHMTTHHDAFRKEMTRRGEEGSEFAEMVPMISNAELDEMTDNRRKTSITSDREDIALSEESAVGEDIAPPEEDTADVEEDVAPQEESVADVEEEVHHHEVQR